MNRRALLRSLAGAGAGGLAGCVDGRAIGGGETTVWTERSPTARSDSRPCPPMAHRDDRAYCDGSSDDWSVTLTADPDGVTLPRGELTVRLENRGTQALQSTADSVSLSAWRDGGWSHVVQKVDEAALETVTVAGGDAREFSISVNTADLGPLYPRGDHDGERQFVFRFPPGTYALGYRVSRGDDDERTYAESFTVTGESPPLESSEKHVETFREDGALVVRTGTEREYDHSRNVSLFVDGLDADSANAADLTPFELYNPGYELVRDVGPGRVFVPAVLTELLRDGFAIAEGSDDRFRVETVDTTTPPLGMQGSKAVTWDGDAWRLTAMEGWGPD